jgi:carbonic anhydrase/acetyltransferase-like protein (isoleucine patch superfamily)
VGQKVFVAGNTTLRADPDTRICINSETNLQDNIVLLALRNQKAPAAPCGKLSSSTGERVSIAHQANIKNSKIGNFTFIGFHTDLNNVVLEDGAFVLHGAKLSMCVLVKIA